MGLLQETLALSRECKYLHFQAILVHHKFSSISVLGPIYTSICGTTYPSLGYEKKGGEEGKYYWLMDIVSQPGLGCKLGVLVASKKGCFFFSRL